MVIEAITLSWVHDRIYCLEVIFLFKDELGYLVNDFYYCLSEKHSFDGAERPAPARTYIQPHHKNEAARPPTTMAAAGVPS